MLKNFPVVMCVFVIAGLGQSLLAKGDFVTPIAIENLVQNPANYFDLQGKTIRFTPSVADSYEVHTLAECKPIPTFQRLEDSAAKGQWYSKGWSVDLPFDFKFSGKSYRQIFVNMQGNISFDAPEDENWPERDAFADGGMYSVAAAIDSRSFAGMEKMIAVFWGTYQDQKSNFVAIHVAPDCVAVTWNMKRAPWGQQVLGTNVFQARLYASGAIELVYPSVSERDGIVGIFQGHSSPGKLLNHWTFSGKAPDPSVEMESADVYDAGSVIDLAITMKQRVLTKVSGGPIDYRCWLTHDDLTDLVTVSVGDEQRMACWLGAAPLTGGWKIDGRRVDMYVSKVLLTNCKQISMAWNTNFGGVPGRFSGGNSGPVNLSGIAPATIKFSKANETRVGNIFEVFHYPVITKASERLLAKIYKTVPANDDIAIVFTDFRIDDVYGIGNGAIAANFPIYGIAKENETPRSTESIGSKQLQMSVATVWLGAPKFDEVGVEDDGTHWFNFAHGVKWLAHECTHRFGMDMSFQNPMTGKEEKLTNGSGHWLAELDTTAMFLTADMFLAHSARGYSVMGGYSWKANSDHTFSQSTFSFQVPGGYSALDLYVMGLLPPERVPPTTIIENLKDLGGNRYSGQAVPVRIEDVVKAMGTRLPKSSDAQKTYRMKFYVVHDTKEKPNTAMIAKAERFAAIMAQYFSRATGGAMKVVPSDS